MAPLQERVATTDAEVAFELVHEETYRRAGWLARIGFAARDYRVQRNWFIAGYEAALAVQALEERPAATAAQDERAGA